MPVAAISEILKAHLVPRDEFIFGFARLPRLTGGHYSSFPYAVSIGKKLNDPILDAIRQGPTPSYYDHYKKTNEFLSELTKRISSQLNASGIRTACVEPSVSSAELDTTYAPDLRTEFSHKMAATRAGLGWIGKTALFVSGKFGPRVRLVTILTDIPPGPPGKPVDRSLCGKCRQCVDACPAGAATGQLWDVSVDRDEFFDPWKCRDMCHYFGKERLEAGARVCGICVAVCPIGRSGRRTANRTDRKAP